MGSLWIRVEEGVEEAAAEVEGADREVGPPAP
jgi:hypothetical protein